MRAKDMFLRKTNLIHIFFIVFIYTGSSYANNELNNSVITYMQELKDCSFSFLQNTDEEISEGSISIGLNRIRIDYQKPSRIIIILDETKGKTSSLKKMFVSLKINSCCIIQNNDASDTFVRAIKNIPNSIVISELGANVYDILKHKKLIITESAIKKLEERLT